MENRHSLYWSGLVLASGVFCLLASQARAVTVDFATSGVESGSYFGNEIVFSEGGLDVGVTAWVWNTWDNEWGEAHVGQSSFFGLYNVNSPIDNSHSIDNQGWIDYVQFSFSQEVDLSEVYMYVFADGDFDYWTGSLNGEPSGTGAPTGGGFSVSHGSSGWVSLSGVTDYLLIGAQYFNDNINRVDHDDRFKIRALEFFASAPPEDPIAVPEGGATLGFLGLVLIGVAGVSRRFRKIA